MDSKLTELQAIHKSGIMVVVYRSNSETLSMMKGEILYFKDSKLARMFYGKVLNDVCSLKTVHEVYEFSKLSWANDEPDDIYVYMFAARKEVTTIESFCLYRSLHFLVNNSIFNHLNLGWYKPDHQYSIQYNCYETKV